MKLLALTLGLYALLELLLHGISYGLACVMGYETRKQQQVLEPSAAHWQAIFYRLFALLVMAMMSHWYTQSMDAAYWQKALVTLAMVGLLVAAVVGTDLSIIQQLKKQSATHYANMHEMGWGYILRHLPAHRQWYFGAAYLPSARRVNVGISLLALLLLYVDLRVYYAD